MVRLKLWPTIYLLENSHKKSPYSDRANLSQIVREAMRNNFRLANFPVPGSKFSAHPGKSMKFNKIFTGQFEQV